MKFTIDYAATITFSSALSNTFSIFQITNMSSAFIDLLPSTSSFNTTTTVDFLGTVTHDKTYMIKFAFKSSPNLVSRYIEKKKS